MATLPESMKPFRTFMTGQGVSRGRGASSFFANTEFRAATNLDLYTLPFPPGALKNWPNLEDIEIYHSTKHGF